MLASSVYHLLYFNGNVLGISGIYRSTISQILGKVEIIKSTLQQSVKTSEEAQADNNTSRSKSTRPNDERWKIAFTAGLVAGGFVLKIFRRSIEERLGTALFENKPLNVLAANPLKSFIIGALVGVGTKVHLVLRAQKGNK